MDSIVDKTNKNNWKVQLAHKFETKRLKDGEWFSLSEKINGVRGTYYDGKIYSRQGKEISGLEHILESLKKCTTYDLRYAMNEMVFDGELIRDNIDNLSDNENFRIGTGIIGSDAPEKPEIKFVIFDMLPKSEFEKGKSIKKYRERLENLRRLKFDESFENKKGNKSLELVPILYSGTYQEVDSQTKINELLEKVIKNGKEGLILNRDTEYQTKRNHGIMKIKKFQTMDLKIKNLEEGTGRLKGTLGAFVIGYKNAEVRVGTGLTDIQRTEFWSLGEKLKGRVVEVKYFSETQDKNTKNYSLQFPSFVRLRELGKSVSYS
ncbi:MAG: hypothetical protein LBJ32_00320 [Oscillospiraceae bacterium]|jgi:DNA ligase-1|nr:hypothetical protein [Oscillospiraceae bacterium]